MQIMEDDIIRTIRENHRYFTHYHTGGCPGRNKIEDTQELHTAPGRLSAHPPRSDRKAPARNLPRRLHHGSESSPVRKPAT